MVSRASRSTSERDEHPEHAVGAVDEREALLLAQHHRLDAVRGRARRRRRPACPSAVRTSPSPITASAQCARGARSPEQPSAAVLADDGGDAGVEQGGVALGDLGAHAGAAGGQGLQPQQHGGAHDLALDLAARARGVAADQRALQLLPLLDAGCAWWRARRIRSRRRSAVPGSSASPSITARDSAMRASASGARVTCASCRATATTSSGRQRARRRS